jgi:hypothetical protein
LSNISPIISGLLPTTSTKNASRVSKSMQPAASNLLSVARERPCAKLADDSHRIEENLVNTMINPNRHPKLRLTKVKSFDKHGYSYEAVQLTSGTLFEIRVYSFTQTDPRQIKYAKRNCREWKKRRRFEDSCQGEGFIFLVLRYPKAKTRSPSSLSPGAVEEQSQRATMLLRGSTFSFSRSRRKTTAQTEKTRETQRAKRQKKQEDLKSSSGGCSQSLSSATGSYDLCHRPLSDPIASKLLPHNTDAHSLPSQELPRRCMSSRFNWRHSFHQTPSAELHKRYLDLSPTPYPDELRVTTSKVSSKPSKQPPKYNLREFEPMTVKNYTTR